MGGTIIFRKAKFMYHAGRVKQVGSSERKEYYSVEDTDSKKLHEVTIETSKFGTILCCDCTKQSLPNKENFIKGKQPLCSHLVAVLFKKYFDTRLKS